MDYSLILYLAIGLFILGMVMTIIGLVNDWYKSNNGWYKALFWIFIIVWVVSILLLGYWLLQRPKQIIIS